MDPTPITRIVPGARGGAYHRVSDLGGRDPEAENYLTEQQAWDKIDSWAAQQKVTIAAEHYYCDRDVSGAKMSRPELDRMIDDLSAGVIDFIVIAKVDRLSRADVGAAMLRVKEIHDIAPGGLAILDLGVDPSNPMGEMILTILLALGRMQWRAFQDNWRDVQGRAIARGVWIGPAPFGYRHTVLGVNPNGKVIHGPLEPDENADTVRQVFKVAAADGLAKATEYLQQHAPARIWRTDITRKVLASRVYLGEVYKTYNRGKPNEHTTVKTNAHPALTTAARFLEAQHAAGPRKMNGDYPLSGLIYCECGGHMKGATMGQHGKQYRRMRCAKCNVSISVDMITPYLRESLRAGLATKRVRDMFAPVGVEAARQAWEDAEGERERYLSDLEARALAGSDKAWRKGLAARAQAAESTRTEYQLRMQEASHYERLPLPDQMDDDEMMTRALRIINRRGRVTVRGGRGTVADRVRFVLDGEDMPGSELTA